MELPKYIEVETSRKCNRTCDWCPNAEHQDRRKQALMPWGLFTRIVDQLAGLSFSGYVAFHNYNEPLLNARIVQEVKYAKASLPDCQPAIYTNGDVLDSGMFDRLLAAGVTYLRVTRYPVHADTPGSHEAIRSWLHIKGLADVYPWTFGQVRQGFSAGFETPTVKVEVISPNIFGAYNNRGGSVTTLPVLTRKRAEPCLMTASSASIDYQGRMKMCCCVFPEAKGHDDYVLGNLQDQTFTELWDSPKMNAWRDLHSRADWSLSPACATCTQPLPETRR